MPNPTISISTAAKRIPKLAYEIASDRGHQIACPVPRRHHLPRIGTRPDCPIPPCTSRGRGAIIEAWIDSAPRTTIIDPLLEAGPG